MKRGIEFPISTMPGEKVAHVYAGPMEAETIHFLECVAKGRQPLVTAEQARMVMQVYQAADISAEEGRPVDILADSRPADWQVDSSDRAAAGRAPVIS
jgi:predicted dehydrogenase